MYGPFPLESHPCPLCGSTERRVVMRKAGVAVPVMFDIVACGRCLHVRVDPRIPDARLDELYDADYYRGRGFDRTVDYEAAESPATLADHDAVIDTVVDALGRRLEGVRWLDVGCGTGGLLARAMARGADAFGTDSSAFAASACAARGLPLLTPDEAAAQAGTFDVVSAVEVIEHVPDPKGLLAFLRSCARVGGVVYVGTGNWTLVRRQPGSPYVMPEGHIQYFTPAVMRRLFAESSLIEADVLNRSWFVCRLLPQPARRALLQHRLARLARIAKRLAPLLAPFPVGIRAV